MAGKLEMTDDICALRSLTGNAEGAPNLGTRQRDQRWCTVVALYRESSARLACLYLYRDRMSGYRTSSLRPRALQTLDLFKVQRRRLGKNCSRAELNN
jgi:hypothetical protein